MIDMTEHAVLTAVPKPPRSTASGIVGEWIMSTLGEVADFQSGGIPAKSRTEYRGGSIPWISAKDMKRFRLDDTEDHVTDIGVDNGTRLVPGGTVLLLARGMTLINDVPICVAQRPMTFNQDVKAHRSKRRIALSNWITDAEIENSKLEFQRCELLFGKLRPYFHKVGVAPTDGVCSTESVVEEARILPQRGYELVRWLGGSACPN